MKHPQSLPRPVATWLAYQFPQIGGVIYRFIQPVEPVIK